MVFYLFNDKDNWLALSGPFLKELNYEYVNVHFDMNNYILLNTEMCDYELIKCKVISIVMRLFINFKFEV